MSGYRRIRPRDLLASIPPLEHDLKLRPISRLPRCRRGNPSSRCSLAGPKTYTTNCIVRNASLCPSIFSIRRFADILLQVKPHLATVGTSNRSRVLEDLDQVASLAHVLCQARNGAEPLPFADDLDLEGSPFLAIENMHLGVI